MAGEREVVYSLKDWTDDRVSALISSLRNRRMPFTLEGDDLVVAAEHQGEIDQLVEAIDGEPPTEQKPPSAPPVDRGSTSPPVPQSAITAPTSRRWPVLFGVLGLVAAVVAVFFVVRNEGDDRSSQVAATTAPEVSRPAQLRGVFSLEPGVRFARDSIGGQWDTCSGRDGYDDFGPGMEVVVTDQAGVVVGNGRTRNIVEGDREDADLSWLVDMAMEDSEADRECHLFFSVRLVDIEDVNFFTVEIGNRGAITHSRVELEENGWWTSSVLG